MILNITDSEIAVPIRIKRESLLSLQSNISLSIAGPFSSLYLCNDDIIHERFTKGLTTYYFKFPDNIQNEYIKANGSLMFKCLAKFYYWDALK